MDPPFEKKEFTEEEENTVDETREIADETRQNADVTIDSAVVEKDQNQETTEEQQQAPHTAEEQCEAPQKQDNFINLDNVLNLNNEVVKMRKEVKRVRALIIRKLTRQIGVLKKKKGKDADIERNQRRTARLLEEIHAIKTLVPDKVTKTALQKNLNFEQVCKDPKSSISDRAVARIATHPQFSKKIEVIKAAVKAFKEERSKEGKLGEKMQKKADKTKKQLQHTKTEQKSNEGEDQTERPVIINHCKTDFVEASLASSSLIFSEVKVERKVQETETPPMEKKTIKCCPVKHVERSIMQKKSEEKKTASKLSEGPLKSEVKAESDFSDSDEKEYFDDSTEERFHKQSSAESEESDNDFFVGKVSKFKKKKKIKSTEDEILLKTLRENSNNPLQPDKVLSELDELESRLKSKVTSLNSVFCTSLAGSKTGKGHGKGDRKFGKQFKRKDGANDGNIDFGKQSKIQKPYEAKQKDSDSKYSKPWPADKKSGREQNKLGGNVHNKEYVRQKDARGKSMFSQAPAQPLHPSWEASKKRKEQQGHILAFQGKKIKFNDDE